MADESLPRRYLSEHPPHVIAQMLSQQNAELLLSYDERWSKAPRLDGERRQGVRSYHLMRHYGLLERTPPLDKKLRQFRLTPLGQQVCAALADCPPGLASERGLTTNAKGARRG